MDIRTQILAALDCSQQGCAQQGRVMLKALYSHRKEILKWGWRGIRIIFLITTILAFPERIQAAGETIRDLLRD